jgi:hypothetical protein
VESVLAIGMTLKKSGFGFRGFDSLVLLFFCHKYSPLHESMHIRLHSWTFYLLGPLCLSFELHSVRIVAGITENDLSKGFSHCKSFIDC